MTKKSFLPFLFFFSLIAWTPQVQSFTYAIEKTVEHWLLENIKKSTQKVSWATATGAAYACWHIGQVVWPQFFPAKLRIKLGILTAAEYIKNISSEDVLYQQKMRRLEKIQEVLDSLAKQTGIKIETVYIKKDRSCKVKSFRFFSKNNLIINDFWLETATTKEYELFRNFSVITTHELAHLKYSHYEISLLSTCLISFIKCFLASAQKSETTATWKWEINKENTGRLLSFYSEHDIAWLILSAINRMFVHESDIFLLQNHSTKDFIKALEFATVSDLGKKNRLYNTSLSTVEKGVQYGTEWINHCFRLYGYSNYPSIRQRMLCAQKNKSNPKTLLDVLSDIDRWIWW